MLVPTAVPRGLGVYLSRVAREWRPRDAAKHAERVRKSRMSHVALCGMALDGWTAPLDVLQSCALTYRELAGVAVSVYVLPGPAAVMRPKRTAETLLRAIDAIEGYAPLLDAEESYSGRHAQLEETWGHVLDGSTEAHAPGVTLYGTPRRLKRYPWGAIEGCGWLGWQCYETAAKRVNVRRDLAELRALWGATGVVPHLATYPRRALVDGEPQDGAVRLMGDFRRTCLDDDGRVDVPGLWLWQDATLDEREVETCAEIAGMLATA